MLSQTQLWPHLVSLAILQMSQQHTVTEICSHPILVTLKETELIEGLYFRHGC